MNRKHFAGFLCRMKSKLSLAVAAVSVGLVALASGTAFGQETAVSIPIQETNINWTELPTKIILSLTTPIVVGIGIALSVWVLFMGIKFLRRSAS